MEKDQKKAKEPSKFWERFKWFILIVDTIILVLLSLLMRKILQSDASGLGAAVVLGFIFIVFIFFLFIWARIVAPIIAGHFADKLARDIMYSGNLTREAPPEHAGIRSKIAKGDFESAMEELKAILREKPRDRYAIELMSDILIDKKHDYPNAVGLLASYFKEAKREDGDFQFVMKLTDVYLELNADDRAIAFLTREMEKKYSPKTIEKISKRLNGITKV